MEQSECADLDNKLLLCTAFDVDSDYVCIAEVRHVVSWEIRSEIRGVKTVTSNFEEIFDSTIKLIAPLESACMIYWTGRRWVPSEFSIIGRHGGSKMHVSLCDWSFSG